MVDPEPHLGPVLSSQFEGRHDSGVVDEDVDARVRCDDARARFMHGASEARSSGTGRATHPRSPPRFRCARPLGFGLVARSHHDLRVLSRKPPRYLEPKPAVRAGHEGDPARQIGDVRGGPRHDRWYVARPRKLSTRSAPARPAADGAVTTVERPIGRPTTSLDANRSGVQTFATAPNGPIANASDETAVATSCTFPSSVRKRNE